MTKQTTGYPSAQPTHVDTEHGPITIPAGVLTLWNRDGWPTDETLQKLAAAQPQDQS